MTQADLEHTVRSTLNARADTVTDGPTWDGADATDRISIATRRRRMWLAPLAAAAVVVFVAAGALALRHDDKPTDSNPAAIRQSPIPKGMRAVDALGVEIFVPKGFKVDALCSAPRVLRPVAETTPAPSCPLSISGTTVSIERARKSAPVSCAERIDLADEHGCLDAVVTLPPVDNSYSATWPAHGVTVTASGRDQRLALQIVRSAHEVPIDRHGCAAARDPMLPSPRMPLSGLAVLPTAAHTVSVCWYLNNRLGASALLSGSTAHDVIGAVNAAPPRWPSPLSRPSLPSCEAVSQRDGVLLTAHTPGLPDVEAVGNFAACNGQQTVYNGQAAVLATQGLADTIGQAALLRLVLDYTPLTR